MWMTSVLLFDSDTTFARTVAELLGRCGSACVVAAEPDDARHLLATRGFSVFLFGCEQERSCLFGLLRSARRVAPHTGQILMVRPGQMHLAIQCMRLGVDDDIHIPFDTDALNAKVASVVQRRLLAPAQAPVPAADVPEGTGAGKTAGRRARRTRAK